MGRKIEDDEFARMWNDGVPKAEIAERFGVSPPAVDKGPSTVDRPAPHVAAVRMPAEPLSERKDWPDLQAAVQRAKASRAPIASLGQVAARFRLPVAVVQGLAVRMQG